MGAAIFACAIVRLALGGARVGPDPRVRPAVVVGASFGGAFLAGLAAAGAWEGAGNIMSLRVGLQSWSSLKLFS